MAVNIHIAADSLTKSGFVLATATCVSVGMKLSLDMGSDCWAFCGGAVTVAGMYGVVQRAADSAERLRICYPAFFTILYEQELEMMYFWWRHYLNMPTLLKPNGLQRQSSLISSKE